jgi:hypothetical protein
MRTDLTTPDAVQHDPRAIAYTRATKVLWIDFLVTMLVLVAVASRL